MINFSPSPLCYRIHCIVCTLYRWDQCMLWQCDRRIVCEFQPNLSFRNRIPNITAMVFDLGIHLDMYKNGANSSLELITRRNLMTKKWKRGIWNAKPAIQSLIFNQKFHELREKRIDKQHFFCCCCCGWSKSNELSVSVSFLSLSLSLRFQQKNREVLQPKTDTRRQPMTLKLHRKESPMCVLIAPASFTLVVFYWFMYVHFYSAIRIELRYYLSFLLRVQHQNRAWCEWQI